MIQNIPRFFRLLSSSILCRMKLRLEFRSYVLFMIVVAVAYEGEYAYRKSTIATFNGKIYHKTHYATLGSL